MKKNKKNILIIIIISIIVLYLVLKDNFAEKVKYLFSVNPIYLLIATAFIITYWILKGLALHLCINEFDENYTRKKSIRLMITTQLFHAITPFASGGQPWQIYKLKKHGISLSKGTNIVIEDFIGYQTALILFGALAVLSNHILHIIPSDDKLALLVTLGFLMNSAVIIALFALSFSRKDSKIIINSIINFLGKIKIIKDTNASKEKSNKFIKDFHQSAEKLFSQNSIIKFPCFRVSICHTICLITRIKYIFKSTLCDYYISIRNAY